MNAWNSLSKSQNYFISTRFLWLKYCLMLKFIEIWTSGNTAYSGQFRLTFISLVNVPWWLKNKWCQINRWLGLHVISLCLVCLLLSNHDIVCSGWDPEIVTADAPQWDEERRVLLGELQTQVAQRPVDNWNHGAR
jgi:hypothetical protein